MTDRGAKEEAGRAALIVRSLRDRFRHSLFGLPALWCAAAVVLALSATELDQRTQLRDLPGFLDTTVESARSILSAITSGTIAAASVVFSFTLISIQLSNAAYSSRVLRSLLRDRFQQHMIGVVTSTFLYSLLILREVRGPLDEGSEPYIPRFSVFVSVVLALLSILALLASISHTTQKLRVSAVTRSLVSDVVQLVREQMPECESNSNVEAMSLAMIAPAQPASERTTGGLVVTAPRRGWVQQISIRVIGRAVAKGSFVRLDASVGSYVSEGAPLLTVWPPPPDTEQTGSSRTLRSAFAIGDERTLQQDIAFGLTMLEDIAVRALSPGVNDPNTAKVVIAQLGDVVLSILERELPPTHVDFEGRTIWRPNDHGYDDYLRLAFDQIRLFASAQPPVQLSLVTTLLAVGTELHRRGRATLRADDALNGLLDRVVVDMQIHARPGFPHPDLDEVLEMIGGCDWAVLERRRNGRSRGS